MKRFWRRRLGTAAQLVSVVRAPELGTNTVKMLYFMLCPFCHSKKEKGRGNQKAREFTAGRAALEGAFRGQAGKSDPWGKRGARGGVKNA